VLSPAWKYTGIEPCLSLCWAWIFSGPQHTWACDIADNPKPPVVAYSRLSRREKGQTERVGGSIEPVRSAHLRDVSACSSRTIDIPGK
jgi:hypothetical protein